MGVIQQGINQLIGIGAMAAKLSTKHKANQQKAKESEEVKEPQAKGFQRGQQKAKEQLQQKEKFNNFREQISPDVQDTINLLKGKDVPTQKELALDKKILKALPNFDDFGEEAKQKIREQLKEEGDK